MPRKSILILGGTAEARAAAAALLQAGHDVETSLAGVTQQPLLPPGRVRVGPFGGVAGLVDYLTAQRVDVVVDATHPFAAVMSAHAEEAARRCGIPVLRLERPAWTAQAGDQWINAASMDDAVQLLPAGVRVLVTTGRKQLSALVARADLAGIIRSIEAPDVALPPAWQLVQDRPPHSIDSEMALMRNHAITHLLTKNAGGTATRAKLDAARALGIPVVMIARPAKPHVPTVATVEALVAALR